ncbi:MAG: 50S ribosomal protein L9 [bacterium]|nr:50S ribosomal protein L9 [bacterium]
MRILLTKDVPDLGGKGEIVEVADGYARNYLVPRKLGIKATTGAVKQAVGMRQARQDAIRREREEAENLATALSGTRVVVAARASDEGKLFGSIGTADIATAVTKFTGVPIEAKVVGIAAPIKEIGLHEVTIKPHAEVTFPITMDVIPA